MQTQFTSSKSVKTWAQYLDKKLNLITWTSLFLSSKSVKTWAQYLNKKLNLKTWTSQFSISKSEKTRETILLAISMTGIGANKMQTHFTSSKSLKTWTQYLKTKLDLKTRTSQFSSSKSWKTSDNSFNN